mmetsp:Transcript_68040/g.220306  ORF Transcript_68040/g.220306 Transcript_68040/m.220306 type:complete len:203 (-) Transcript_68040:1589-2197(-)
MAQQMHPRPLEASHGPKPAARARGAGPRRAPPSSSRSHPHELRAARAAASLPLPLPRAGAAESSRPHRCTAKLHVQVFPGRRPAPRFAPRRQARDVAWSRPRQHAASKHVRMSLGKRPARAAPCKRHIVARPCVLRQRTPLQRPRQCSLSHTGACPLEASMNNSRVRSLLAVGLRAWVLTLYAEERQTRVLSNTAWNANTTF